MVPVIEYMDVPRIEKVPRVITEEVEELIRVPVVREVPVTRMVEIPTGKYVKFLFLFFIFTHIIILSTVIHFMAPYRSISFQFQRKFFIFCLTAGYRPVFDLRASHKDPKVYFHHPNI